MGEKYGNHEADCKEVGIEGRETFFLNGGLEMTVAELINFLKQQPQDIQVVYEIYSEQKLLEIDEIEIKLLSLPRKDGWVHDQRPDKPTQTYLVFP